MQWLPVLFITATIIAIVSFRKKFFSIFLVAAFIAFLFGNLLVGIESSYVMLIELIAMVFTGFYIQKHSFRKKDIRIGYFEIKEDTFLFRSLDILVQKEKFYRYRPPDGLLYPGSFFHYVATPKYLYPFKNASLFWINIGYSYERGSLYERHFPLNIHKQTREQLPESLSDNYMLFALGTPTYSSTAINKQYYIVYHEDQLTLILARYIDDISCSIMAYSILGEIYTEEHFYGLDSFRS